MARWRGLALQDIIVAGARQSTAVEKRNFTRGIFSPEVQARKDVDIYSAGARRLTNVVLQKFGGVIKRQGTEYVFEFPENNVARLLPFTYSTGQSYAMLMGQASLRIIAAVLGKAGMVVTDCYGITGITKANPAVITAPYHDLTTGDQVYISGETGMDEINGSIYTVTVLTANTFSIPIDSTLFGTWTGSTCTVRVGAPSPAPTPPAVPSPTPTPTPPATVPYERPPTGGGDIP
jgi:hypothetical protein